MFNVMDKSPGIAAASRDPGEDDGRRWNDGTVWLNTKSRHVFRLIRTKKASCWTDVTEQKDVVTAYLVSILGSAPFERLAELVDTWIG